MTSDKKEGSTCNSPSRRKKDIVEQRSQATAAKLRQIEAEFWAHADVTFTSKYLDIDFETTEAIFFYWKLKRRVSVLIPYLIILIVIRITIRILYTSNSILIVIRINFVVKISTIWVV